MIIETYTDLFDGLTYKNKLQAAIKKACNKLQALVKNKKKKKK